MMRGGTREILALIEDMLPEGRVLADGAGHQVNDVREGGVLGTRRTFVGGLGAGETDFVVVAGLFLNAMIGFHDGEFGDDAGGVDVAGREFRGIVREGFEEVLHRTRKLLRIWCECHCLCFLTDGSTRRHTEHGPASLLAAI